MTQLSAPTTIDHSLCPSTGWARVADFAQLAKLRITAMVAATTWLGFVFGQQADEHLTFQIMASHPVGPMTLVAALLGASLSCMGAATLNQVRERDVDRLMHRTRQRPLPTGRVAATHAALFGVVLAATGVGLLAAFTNWIAASLAAFTVLSYVFIYTPMKRISSTCVLIGAVPGAIPPVIGYAAAASGIGPGAWAMFAIMMMWQVPHFLAIAWLYREDYGRAGMPMLPVVDPSGTSTFRQMLIGCLALLPLGLLPTMLGLCGMTYFIGALLAGLAFLAFGFALMAGRTAWHARAMFFASLVYLPLVLALMVIDRT